MRRETLILGMMLSGGIHAGGLYALSSGMIGGSLGATQPTREEFLTQLSLAPLDPTPLPEREPEHKPAATKPETPPPPPPPPPPPLPTSEEREMPQEPAPDQLVAGIDDGSKTSPNWQGFKEETAHRAPISSVEQSAMTPKIGLPVPEEALLPARPAAPVVEATPAPAPALAEPTPPQPTPTPPRQPVETPPPPREEPKTEQPPTPAEQPTPEDVKPTPPVETPPPEAPPAETKATEAEQAQVAEETRPEPPEGSKPGPERKEAESARPAESPDALSEVREIGTGEAEAARPAEAPERAVEPAPAPIPVTPPPPAPVTPESPAAAQKPGERSMERAAEGISAPAGAGLGNEAPEESDASALKESFAVEPGKTLAREGIQVRTARPRWSTTTKVTAVPRNPLIDITFDAKGRVIKAAFAPGRSTGYADVDGPLLDSIYRWRAAGEKFERAVVATGSLRLRFKMLLIEEGDSTPLPIPADRGRRP